MPRRKFNFKKKLPMQSNIQMTAYELNKLAYAKLPLLTMGTTEWDTAIQRLCTYITTTSGRYYMLLSHDVNLHYYTVFNINPKYPEQFSDVFEECINNIGALIDIEYVEDTNICEVWIRKGDEITMYVFFNYDMGVIECKL